MSNTTKILIKSRFVIIKVFFWPYCQKILLFSMLIIYQMGWGKKFTNRYDKGFVYELKNEFRLENFVTSLTHESPAGQIHRILDLA
ncbi:hypothetical protein BpHYR1_044820 [Brachionus plicatilis]|uniref:Uncharacterized protein n=1 Tax=Brachionus plicatilis TaxID=10195 RepID=A0A3M7P8J4_BRAPC|nr:hypothetical protein BpHYR1_044820 [Brachionus plicatilis]